VSAPANPAVVHRAVRDTTMPEPTLSASAPSADVFESFLPMWPSDRAGTMKSGIWQASPGHLEGKREGWAEICHIIEGRATITTEGGAAEEIGPGDVLVLPEGWRGTWDIHEPIRKFYALQRFDDYAP
jgi:uncharacterized protein